MHEDLEKISQDLIEALSAQKPSSQTMEILTEVEENVKKFARVILNDVIGLISPLRMQSAVDARDFSKLINSVKEKISESEEIASNMFSQFKEIVNELDSPDKPQQVEAFKSFIRRLGESVDNRVQEISQGGGTISSGKIASIEQSLENFLEKYIYFLGKSAGSGWHWIGSYLFLIKKYLNFARVGGFYMQGT